MKKAHDSTALDEGKFTTAFDAWLAQRPKAAPTLKSFIASMKPKLIEARRKGVTYEQLVVFLREQGVACSNTKPINIHEAASLDQLLNALEEDGVAHWLVDLGAQSGDRLVQWMAETEFLTVCVEMNIAVTIAFVISPVKDSTALLKMVTGQLGSSVDYVIVKNEASGHSFPIYDASKTRARLTGELGAIEISMPEVLEQVYYRVDQLNLPWTAAVQGMELQLAERQRVRAFTRAAFAEIEKAAAVLIG
jgi:hypothetical protein